MLAEDDRLRGYLEEAPVIIRAEDGTILHWSRGAQQLYGFTREQALGSKCRNLLATWAGDTLDQLEERLRRTGRWQGRLHHTTRDGGEIWAECACVRQASPVGPIVVEVHEDVSDRVSDEAQKQALALELEHRLKNILTVVQALARLSFSKIDPGALSAFEHRLIAVARAQDLLRAREFEGADLGSVVERAAETFQVLDRVVVQGPPVRLKPNAVLAYSLALHELLTNSIKHGSLSVPDGFVRIAWSVVPETGRIHFLWRERGGPPVKPPARDGFGTHLIRRVLASELGDPVQLRYEPSGFECEFDGPTQKAPQLGTAQL